MGHITLQQVTLADCLRIWPALIHSQNNTVHTVTLLLWEELIRNTHPVKNS